MTVFLASFAGAAVGALVTLWVLLRLAMTDLSREES